MPGRKKENSVFLLIALRGQNILFLHRQNRNINAKGEFFMAEIQVTNLTFEYEGSFEPVFEEISFSVDTNWKLGFIGRNGKGKTTFLNLLMGKYPYQGKISTSTVFDYFPYHVTETQKKQTAAEFFDELKPSCELWRVLIEMEDLQADAALLYRPFGTLSFGEQTKVLLAVLFSGENDFLLIDEPTNHLDQDARACVREYLKKKKGFILVSHDRDLLDACIDHVLVLNRGSIEVQSGNFTSWWENKRRKDQFALAENEKHLQEIASLRRAADRSSRWAEKNENTKIGFDPIKEHARCISTRAFIGAKTKKMQSRIAQYEKRMEREIEEKEGLLQDIEQTEKLHVQPLIYPKERLIFARNLCAGYPGGGNVIRNLNFELLRGERVFLHGKNGCGKSTLLHLIRNLAEETGNRMQDHREIETRSGLLTVGAGLTISYISQDTGFLSGTLSEYCRTEKLDYSLLLTLLRKLDFERTQFEKPMESFSEGQKKKVLIAASFITPAHLYIWDEPLNYIDVFSRMQIEQLLLSASPTMLVVDHDVRFQKKLATRTVKL